MSSASFGLIQYFLSAVEGMRKESRIFNSSRYLAILLFVYQGQMLSHPTGQWFRRQLCCLKSWIIMERCHHIVDEGKEDDLFCIVQRMSWLIPCNR